MAGITTAPPPLKPIKDFSKCHEPVKRIFTGDDIAAWLESEALARLMTVLVRCNLAIKGKRADVPCRESETVKAVVRMLDQLEGWVDEIPLHTGPQRFGNKAFRDWSERLQAQSGGLHREWLDPSLHPILPELLYYFTNAFGNAVRIDYGSGHELSFLGYLAILRYVGLLTEEDEQAMVFRLFEKYLGVCRKLQKVYRLEPAGSKGVWGLEDHQFLNFLWGSSQLIGQEEIRPADILNKSLADSQSSAYIYLSSIAHIHALKRGPFNEHSPVLHNIASTVPNWSKVNSGLLKMYRAEVLEKPQVVQHFWFGELLPWRRAVSMDELPTSGPSSALTRDGPSKGLPESSTGDEHPVATAAAPWADPMSSRNPMSATAAPWAASANANAGQALPVTAAPWASANGAGAPMQTATNFPSRLSGTGFERTLRATGSAAAMSSPLGSISQPATGVSRSMPPSRQQGGR